jgi:hypothetical protein
MSAIHPITKTEIQTVDTSVKQISEWQGRSKKRIEVASWKMKTDVVKGVRGGAVDFVE